MEKWLKPALDYIPRWLQYQVQQHRQPGCAFAVAHQGRVALEGAFGHADLATGEALTPRHRFRVASHSKSFTAAGFMLLRERGKLRLDDPVGKYVDGLHRQVAEATLAQLLSHSAGLVRDGWDAGQWLDRRGFLNAAELRADLKRAPLLDANTRFKYSNHGFGLLGLALEQITGEAYGAWMAREVVAAAGLGETLPDFPAKPPRSFRLARGHSAVGPAGQRHVVPGDNPAHALAAATGFVATAADMARYFAQLDPKAKASFLSPASRREMLRRQWRPPGAMEQHYGYGTMSGKLQDWDWYGHNGGFQGTLTRSFVLPEPGLSVSVLTNAMDGLSGPWADGIAHILRAFARYGAPSRRVADWGGRWWSAFGAGDWLPMGNRVLVATPAWLNPLLDATEIVPTGRDRGRIDQAGGYGNYGEAVSLQRGANGKVKEVQFAGFRLLPEARVVREIRKRYKPAK